MADVKLVNPESLSPPIGFSHAAVSDGWIFLGGQISSNNAGSVVHAGDIAAQFEQALTNVMAGLRAAGGSASSIVKLTYYVPDVTAYRQALKPIGKAYREILGNRYPAASLFEVKGLFEPDAMIEIECV